MGWKRIELSYERQIQKGSTKVCVCCCGGLFFSTKVSKVKMSKAIIEWSCTEETADTVFSVEPADGEDQGKNFCQTYKGTLKKKKALLDLCLENGLK